MPASASHITWVHTAGKSPQKYLPETTGAGCAFLDYDNDGWMDIYLVNSGKCDFYNPDPPLRNALYRNNRDGTFTDVTEKAGVAAGGYGQGVAVGDYDGDGFPDLYVTQYGKSILYHNNGDGTFSDVTEKAGVAAPGWASSAVWFDYDNDGRLDLFVCNFVEFNKSKNLNCVAYNKPGYCVPTLYKPSASWLFHNNGDGTFTDVSQSSGIAKHLGKAWGVVATDLNNDGRMDLFVANDTLQNFLYMNRGNGKFEEIAALAGVGFSESGRPRSGMGVDSADFNQDGWMDLFVANIDHERFSLYQNNHDETFDDQANATSIGAATRLLSGWGLKFFDYDNDGNLDLFLANGNPDDMIETMQKDVTYREPLYAVSQRRQDAAQRQRGKRAALCQESLLPGPRHRRLRQRWRRGRAGLGQRCGSAAHAQPCRQRQSLAGNQAGGQEVESRRDRRARHLPGRRSQAQQNKGGRRKLFVIARSAHGAWPWARGPRSTGWK